MVSFAGPPFSLDPPSAFGPSWGCGRNDSGPFVEATPFFLRSLLGELTDVGRKVGPLFVGDVIRKLSTMH